MSGKERRKTANVSLLAKNENLFRCPICSGHMKLAHLKSLICTNNHCFDLAKQGYVNLLPQAQQSKYDKQMYQSRRLINEKGFFEPLNTKISEIIINKLAMQSKPVKLLDAGCGEGSLLARIQEKITPSPETGPNLVTVGLDITKEGIFLAAKEYKNTIWIVGDLAKAPLASQQFDFILNILSPANYAEFQRLLAGGGIVIKVIPEKAYLQELRAIFYDRTDKQCYSNDHTPELFKSKFKLMDVIRVRYGAAPDHTWLASLIHMTPLSWGTTKERLQKAVEMNLREVTVDLTILVGKNQP